jgi:ribose transport system permease protein
MRQREHERTPAALAGDPAAGSRAWRLDRAGAYLRDSHRLRQIGLPLTVVALFAVFALTSDVFFTVRNFQNVGLAAAALALVSAGQCFVVLTAGIDLSVGSTAALVSVVGAIAMRDSGLAAGVAAGLFTGLGVGIVNALVVTVLGVAPFVATLAMLSIASGLALSISGGTPITGVPGAFSDLAGQRVAGIPVLAVIAIVLFLVAWLVLRFTRFGRYVYAIGGNAEAARLSGIRVAAVTFATYAICSTFAAAGGLVLTARIASGQPTTGTSLALESIAAVVLGGVSLFGGRGSIVGVAFGVVFVTVLANGLNLLGVSSYTQLLVLGAALIAVLAIDRRISGETR